MPAELSVLQQMLLHRKIHVAERAYAQSGEGAQAHFSSGWGAAIESARLLGRLPETALGWWAEQPNGHLLLTADDDSYHNSYQNRLGSDEWVGVASLPMEWLVGDEAKALAAALRPLDHLLGCGCDPAGPWLSDGGGISPRWQRVGAQIIELFSLGYGASPASREDPHRYLAEGLAQALLDRRGLNANDPKLERLIFSSLLSEGFWRNFAREGVPRELMDADEHRKR